MKFFFKATFFTVLIFNLTGCVPIWFDDPMPNDWPIATNITCRNVVGRYIDPNSMHGGIATVTQQGVRIEKGGTADRAWDIFGFYEVARLADSNVHSREFTLSFDDESALNVAYWVNGINVAKKIIPLEKYKCQQGVLKFVSDFDNNARFDKGTNGSTSKSVELISSNQFLYVKYILVMRTSMSGVPVRSTVTTWPRFPVESKQ